jgi:hypothetical protein
MAIYGTKEAIDAKAESITELIIKGFFVVASSKSLVTPVFCFIFFSTFIPLFYFNFVTEFTPPRY